MKESGKIEKKNEERMAWEMKVREARQGDRNGAGHMWVVEGERWSNVG